MKIFMTIIAFFPFLIYGQEKGTFRVELGSDYRSFNLYDFNETLNNKEYLGSDNFDNVAIKYGVAFGLNISYSINDLLSLGIYGETQMGSLKQKIYYQVENEFGNPTHLLTLIRDLKIQSYSLGLCTNLILNNLTPWKEKVWLSNIESNISLQAGFGKALFLTGSNLENATENNLAKGLSYSKGFQLTTSFKMGYILTKTNYFSSIGFKIGYQYFETSELKVSTRATTPPNFQGTSLVIYCTDSWRLFRALY